MENPTCTGLTRDKGELEIHHLFQVMAVLHGDESTAKKAFWALMNLSEKKIGVQGVRASLVNTLIEYLIKERR